MAFKTVNVEITPTGEVLVDLNGFQGVGCDALAEAIVGKNHLTNTTFKPEYRTQVFNPVKK